MRTNKRMPIKTRVCVTAGVACAFLVGPGAAAAQEPKCLDNNGVFNVDVGAMYSDASGNWICEPGAEGATAGGWIRVAIPESTSVPPTPTTAAPIPTPDGERVATGEGEARVLFPATVGGVLLAIGAFIAIGTVAAFRRRPRMSGYLHVEEVRRARP